MFTLRVLRYLALPVIAGVAVDADAQFYRRGAGGSVIVRAPFVGVNVTPGGVSVRAPGVSVNTPRDGYARPVYGGGTVYHGTPVVVGSPVVAQPSGVVVQESVVASPTPAPVPQRVERRMSEADLAALGTPELLAQLANKSTELNAELGGLSGGEGWQSYLAMPEGVAVGRADAGLLKKLLARFDSVARDSQFAMIAGLGGFEPVRTALRVTVDRLEAAPAIPLTTPPAAPVAPAAGESLPTPAADGATTEKSVLKL